MRRRRDDGRKTKSRLAQEKKKAEREKETDGSDDLIVCVGVNVCLSVIYNYQNVLRAVQQPHLTQGKGIFLW